MSTIPMVQYDQRTAVENQAYVVVFVVLAAVIAAIAGGVAMLCVWRGGNLEWTTKYWIYVKVACRFR